MKKDKEFDDIFRKGLGEPADAGYQEQDWNALEQMLDGNKKRRGIIFWLPVLSVAAILLIAFGLWFLEPGAVQHQKPKLAMARPGDNTPQNVNANVNAVARPKVNTMPGKGLAANTAKTVNAQAATGNTPQLKVEQKNELAASTANAEHDKGAVPKHTLVTANKTGPVIAVNPTDSAMQTRDALSLVAFSPGTTIGGVTGKRDINSFDIAKNIRANSRVLQATQHNTAPTNSIFLAHPQFALSIIGAPELNGVSSFQQAKSGTNLGLLFSAGVFKKITFSTGAMYSIKPYNAYFGNYYEGSQANNTLTSINANCRVLDIPLNVDFQFYNNHQNKFSIGSGLSSYIMLHESYQYNYANPVINSPVNYTVPNTNKYFFGILNLQATYTRQIASNVGLSVQPYVKLPLTGIGANNAKLQTTGVAIGLSWNLNSLSKP
jgi:hypothetical protein